MKIAILVIIISTGLSLEITTLKVSLWVWRSSFKKIRSKYLNRPFQNMNASYEILFILEYTLWNTDETKKNKVKDTNWKKFTRERLIIKSNIEVYTLQRKVGKREKI